MENEALERARTEYAQVESRYVQTLKEKGLVFANPHQDDEACQRLRKKLAERGVRGRNAGASLSWGYLSPACVECTGARGSETFSTTFKCHRDCYFCFNRNQADYERFFREGCPWEEGLVRSYAQHPDLACVGLTGGEPLLDIDETIRFLEKAQSCFPHAHLRMYTSGDLLTEEMAERLRKAGLQEIRFSVKDDDTPQMQQRVLDAMQLAKRSIPSVMAEMPVVPGAEEHMWELLCAFDRIGIDGINLLEFCFPFSNWEDFVERGLTLKNPPFEVMYDYGYSGGLAIAGSERTILELMDRAIEEGLRLGLHYCSLENKHRSEIRQKNERARLIHPCLSFDEDDFFLKAAKVFGQDVEPARTALLQAGETNMITDETEESLTFPLAHLELIRSCRHPSGDPLQPQVCFFVYECDDEGAYLTDVALR